MVRTIGDGGADLDRQQIAHGAGSRKLECRRNLLFVVDNSLVVQEYYSPVILVILPLQQARTELSLKNRAHSFKGTW